MFVIPCAKPPFKPTSVCIGVSLSTQSCMHASADIITLKMIMGMVERRWMGLNECGVKGSTELSLTEDNQQIEEEGKEEETGE